MQWITNNIGTLAAALVLAGLVCAIIFKLLRDKKQGKSSCGCDCAHCSGACSCNKYN